MLKKILSKVLQTVFFSLFLTVFVSAGSAFAANRYYDSSNASCDGTFSNLECWDTSSALTIKAGVAPTSADVAYFVLNSGDVYLTADTVVGYLYFQSGYTGTFNTYDAINNYNLTTTQTFNLSTGTAAIFNAGDPTKLGVSDILITSTSAMPIRGSGIFNATSASTVIINGAITIANTAKLNAIDCPSFTANGSGVSLTIQGGTFEAPSGTIRIRGGYTIWGGTIIHYNGGTVEFFGNANSSMYIPTYTYHIPNINLNKDPAYSFTMASGSSDTLYVDGTLTLTNGLLNAGNIVASGTLNWLDTWDGALTTSTTGVLNIQTTSDVVIPNGTATWPGITIDNTNKADLLVTTTAGIQQEVSVRGHMTLNGTPSGPDNLIFDNIGNLNFTFIQPKNLNINGGTFKLRNSIVSTSDFSLYQNGTFDGTGTGQLTTNAYSNPNLYGGTMIAPPIVNVLTGINLSIDSNFVHNNGKIIIYGSQNGSISNDSSSAFYDLEINKSTSLNSVILIGNVLVDGSFTLTKGTVTNEIGANLTVSGNWNMGPAIDAIFNVTGNVTFDGVDQYLTGDTTFGSLTKSHNSSLIFEAGSTTTITGALTLTGASELNRLVLESSIPGSTWYIDAPALRNEISFVDVRDSTKVNTSNTAKIDARISGSVSSGNNVNWLFDSNRYWVGSDAGCATKTWNDPNCWSLSSGGAGGAGVPITDQVALFTSADTSNALISADININNAILLDTGYTGTLSSTNLVNVGKLKNTSGTLTLSGASGKLTTRVLTAQGGTINGGAQPLDADEFDLINGTFNAPPLVNTVVWHQQPEIAYNNNNGTVNFVGNDVGTYDLISVAASPFYNVTVTKDTAGDALNVDPTGGLTVQGSLTTNNNITGGVVSLAGDLINASVSTNYFEGQVILNGTNQSITGDYQFNGGLEKIVTSADTLTIGTGSTLSIDPTGSAVMTLRGAENNLLSLRSSVPGEYYYINAFRNGDGSYSSLYNFVYLDVQDAYNPIGDIDNTALLATTGVDSGNNVWWEFLIPPPDYGVLLEQTNVTWNIGGDKYWIEDLVTTHDGVDSAGSGNINDSQTSTLTTTVNGPYNLSFWWKVSSEENYDFLRFYIDSIEQVSISGEVDWYEETYTIPSGIHELTWTYEKDNVVSSGSDMGWLDMVTLVGPPANPVTQSSPINNAVIYDATPIFAWEDIANEDTYKLEVTLASDTTFDTPVLTMTGILANSTSVEASSALNLDTDYIWRVWGVDAVGAGDPGAGYQGFSITTAPLVVPEFSTYMYFGILLFSLTLIYIKREELKFSIQKD